MNGYNYTNNHGADNANLAEYCRSQYEMYKTGEITGKDAKTECRLMGRSLNLKTGTITPINTGA